MRLKNLSQGESAIIVKVLGIGAFKKRIAEMGFVAGKKVTVIRKAPMQDPIQYKILDSHVSLRNCDAELIEVIESSKFEAKNPDKSTGENFDSQPDSDNIKKIVEEKSKTINIAFVGNPNCGKTTIFNHASNSKEKVGNYGGVTVDAKKAHFKYRDYTINAWDLPGTYSISSYTPEELFVRDHLIEQLPDIVVNVIDSTNLERNLYLTTQLIDMDIKVVVALNMFDELKKSGNKFDFRKLGRLIGVPIIPTIGKRSKGIEHLLDYVVDVFEERDEVSRHVHVGYGEHIENAIVKLQKSIRLPANQHITNKISSRYIAIKLLEKDEFIGKRIAHAENRELIYDQTAAEIKSLEQYFSDDIETRITDARYGFVAGALRETLVINPEKTSRRTESIDEILTHKFFGIPIFILFMWVMFYSTFRIGQYPMNWIENGIGLLSNLLQNSMAESMLRDLLVNGILGGVGGVLVFIPNILIIYFFISMMEDTGYMARAVFIMDKAMHKMGLHGQSFIPLLMGFGCNVPAISSTRIIRSKHDRLLTILINPFMSCSARLPVYILLITAFFANNQGSILFAIYFLGIFIAIVSAQLFRRTLIKKSNVPFVMELPPYRIPTFKANLKNMWFRTSQYIKKITGIVLIASVIIWALGYFPRDISFSKDYDSLIEIANSDQNTELSQDLILEKESERQSKSYIGQIGHFIQPVMSPLGFDWRMSVGILTGIAAKEVVVGTLGVLFQASETNEASNSTLVEKLKTQKYSEGPKAGTTVFNPLVALAFMVFILIYFPCVGVIAVIKKETGGWKWPIFIIVYTCSLAWIASFLVYQIGSLII